MLFVRQNAMLVSLRPFYWSEMQKLSKQSTAPCSFLSAKKSEKLSGVNSGCFSHSIGLRLKNDRFCCNYLCNPKLNDCIDHYFVKRVVSDSICPATHLDKRHILKHPSNAGCTSSAVVYHGCHHKIHKHKEIGGSKTRPKLSRKLPCFFAFFAMFVIFPYTKNRQT